MFFIFSFKKNNKCKISYYNPHIIVDDVDFYSKKFKNDDIVFIKNIFDLQCFNILKSDVMNNIYKAKRNDLQYLRKASTVKATDITKEVANLYYSIYFLDFLKKITGLNSLENVNCDDESSMNIFVYDKPEDFITWHKDPNHYIGNRLTVLINIVNTNNDGDLSDSELQYMIKGKEYSIKMPPNSIVIFQGSKINHRATSIGEDGKRIILSFTYCDICKESLYGCLSKNIKNKVLGY